MIFFVNEKSTFWSKCSYPFIFLYHSFPILHSDPLSLLWALDRVRSIQSFRWRNIFRKLMLGWGLFRRRWPRRWRKIEEIKEATKKVARLESDILAITKKPTSLTYPIKVEKSVVGDLRKHFDDTIKVNKLAMKELHETFQEMIKVERAMVKEL